MFLPNAEERSRKSGYFVRQEKGMMVGPDLGCESHIEEVEGREKTTEIKRYSLVDVTVPYSRQYS